MVARDGQFFEIRSAATAGSAHPTITLHSLKDMSQGVSVTSRDSAALKVTMTHGLMTPEQKTLMLETTSEVPLDCRTTRFTLSPDRKLQMSAPAGTAPVQVRERRIDSAARPAEAPIRALPITVQ